MKVKGIVASGYSRLLAGSVLFGLSFGSTAARAQAPYLIPYTINTAAGGNAKTTVGTSCSDASGRTGTAQDTYGDGCPATSSAIFTNTDLHDVGVDPIGNVYFLDIGTYTMVRKIDARSGIVTVIAGSDAGSNLSGAAAVCTATIDQYGDNCPASDGKGNINGGYTAKIGKARGMAVAKNGDVYFSAYGSHLAHKISASTGLMTLIAGFEAGGTVTSPTKNVGSSGYTGDGGSATTAKLFQDRGLTADAAGNVYIADTANNVIRMVSASTGFISTIVGTNPGNGTPAPGAYGGDAGPANRATLFGPEDVEIDASGNLFIADFSNARIRVVYAGGAAVANLIALTNSGTTPQVGYIYTIIGGGATAYTAGSQVLATSVSISNPRKIAIDGRGNVYLADSSNAVILFLDATTGYIRTIAGTYGKTSGVGCAGQTSSVGDGCPATQGILSPNSAMGVAVGPQGDVYISDSGNARIRKVSINTAFPAVPTGSSSAQTLQVHFAISDGPAASSAFSITGSMDFSVNSSATACTLNSDNTTDCTLSVVFTPSGPGPEAASLAIRSQAGLTTKLSLSGTGTASSVAMDPGTATLLDSGLNSATGIAQDANGNIYVADTGNNRVLLYNGSTSTVIAGTGTSGYSGDGGLATAAKLAGPKAVAVASDGTIYIADTGNNAIRRIDANTGFISTYGGGSNTLCSAQIDGLGNGCLATYARFSAPAGLVADPTGNLYVSDTGNSVIREIGPTGYVFLVAGGASLACTTGDVYGNGCLATQSILKSPTALQIDVARNLYIADTGNNEVRKITSGTGIVSVLAGTGQPGGSGNGGLATIAQVNAPTGLALDAAGDLYISDTGNHVLRVVNAAGTINTVAGTLGANGTGTLPGSASGVLLNLPGAVAASATGKLWILDSGNNRLLSLDRDSAALNFGRNNVGASSPTITIQETATGTSAANLGYPLFNTAGSTTAFTLVASGANGCSSMASLPLSLPPGTSCSLAAQFVPTTVGTVSATFTESNAATTNSPPPSIVLSGTGAVLTNTTVTTAVTTPATGSPQYSIAFVVTATVHPAQCDPTAPNCSAAGTITFFVDGTQVGLPVAVYNTSTTADNVITASATINGQSVGKHSVVAVYSGDTYYASSTASTLSVSVAQGATATVVAPNLTSLNQFATLTLSAKVTSATSNIPTGNVSFYSGTTLLGSSGVNPTTGIATLNDSNPATTLGLLAGAYNITGVYSGDSNYAASTSAVVKITVNPDPQGFTISLSSSSAGTAQGSTATTLAYVTPSNTLNGTLTFSCSNMPANSTCTFGATPSPTEVAGQTLTFTPVPGPATQQSLMVTLWTNVSASALAANHTVAFPSNPHKNTALAGLIGWPMLLGAFTAVIGFRKRLGNARLLTLLAVVALTGSGIVMTGCTGASVTSASTPVGTYTVLLTVTGPNGLVQTTPITFTVGPGIAGQS
jgi:sugar lactone lactonase YvrE